MKINFGNSDELEKIFGEIYKYELKTFDRMLKKNTPIKCVSADCVIPDDYLYDKINKAEIELVLRINILHLFIDVVFENSHAIKRINKNVKSFKEKYLDEYIDLNTEKDENGAKKLDEERKTELTDYFENLCSNFEKEVSRTKECIPNNCYFYPQVLMINDSRTLQISSNKKINIPNFESYIWTKLILSTVPLLYSIDEKAFNNALTIIYPTKNTYKGAFYKIMRKIYTEENSNDIDAILFFYYIEQVLRPSLIMSIDELAYNLSHSIYDPNVHYNRIAFLSGINEHFFAQILPSIIGCLLEYPFSYKIISQILTDNPFHKIGILNMCINIKYKIKKKYGEILTGYLHKTNDAKESLNPNTSNLLCEFIKNNKQYYFISPQDNFEIKSNSEYIVNFTALTFLINNRIKFNSHIDCILNFPYNKFYSYYLNTNTFSEEELTALNSAIKKVLPTRYNSRSKRYTAFDILTFLGVNTSSQPSQIESQIKLEFYKIMKKNRKTKK